MADESCWNWQEIWEIMKAEKPRGQRMAVLRAGLCREGYTALTGEEGGWVLLIPAL